MKCVLGSDWSRKLCWWNSQASTYVQHSQFSMTSPLHRIDAAETEKSIKKITDTFELNFELLSLQYYDSYPRVQQICQQFNISNFNAWSKYLQHKSSRAKEVQHSIASVAHVGCWYKWNGIMV